MPTAATAHLFPRTEVEVICFQEDLARKGGVVLDLACLGQRQSRPVAAGVATDSKFGLVRRSSVGALPIR